MHQDLNRQKSISQYFTKKYIQKENLSKISTSLVNREMQIKIKWQYVYHISEWLNMKNTKYWRGCKAIRALMFYNRRLNEHTHSGKPAVFIQAKIVYNLWSSNSTPGYMLQRNMYICSPKTCIRILLAAPFVGAKI